MASPLPAIDRGADGKFRRVRLLGAVPRHHAFAECPQHPVEARSGLEHVQGGQIVAGLDRPAVASGKRTIAVKPKLVPDLRLSVTFGIPVGPVLLRSRQLGRLGKALPDPSCPDLSNGASPPSRASWTAWKAMVLSQPSRPSKTLQSSSRVGPEATVGCSVFYLFARLASRCSGPEGLLVRLGEGLDGGDRAKSRLRANHARPIAGTRLVREWQGVEQVVTVTADGFEWQGRPYRSISAIARGITGKRRNGWVFFGLRRGARRAAETPVEPLQRRPHDAQASGRETNHRRRT